MEEKVIAPDISKKIYSILKKVDRPGTFCASGSVPPNLPGLEVSGIGPIGLPMTAAQTKQLKKACEQAPYGKGEKTLVNTDVRRVWRLKPSRFSLKNPNWQAALDEILNQTRMKLGLEDEKLEAHLYELLLYEPGSFFLPHRDGEKLDRMIATLVVVLPSVYEGGELIVRLDGQEQTIDFAADAAFRNHFAAFYADCEHEVKPLKSGHRVSLIYNLTLAGKGKKSITAPRAGESVEGIARLLRKWGDQADAAPAKLAVILKHQYTEAGLNWDALKGVDRAWADILATAAAAAGCRAYLAQLTLWESGEAEDEGYGYGGRYGRKRRYHYDDEDEDEDEDDEDSGGGGNYTMQEVYDSSVTGEKWSGPAGEKPPLGAIPVELNEVVPPGSLKAVEPEEDFHGFTGNEGSPLERWYRHAAIFLWPVDREIDVLCQVGSREAVPMLAKWVGSIKDLEGGEAIAQKERSIRFASKILQNWPTLAFAHGHEDDTKTGDPFSLLRQLDDENLFRLYFAGVLVKDVSVPCRHGIDKIAAKHGWTRFAGELTTVFAATTLHSLDRNSRLLEELCVAGAIGTAKKPHDSSALATCRTLADTFLAALKGIDQNRRNDNWNGLSMDRAPAIARLVRALISAQLDDVLAQLVDHIESTPKVYPLRTVQVPTLLELATWTKQAVKRACAPLSAWIAHCQQQLTSMTAVMPAAPIDFRRGADVACTCEDCTALKRFLLDPTNGSFGFRVAEARRRHLETAISGNRLDLVHKTEKKGSPHVLVCSKTTATYERLLKEYHENLKYLEKLNAMATYFPR